ncbi:MAG: extracellular solute-binding protein, partial [Patescibacteria group bacterium]|nr:extracellular solute-binding protein [Patescibacteria group bacterium]
QQAAAPESLTIWGDTQNKDVWSQIISDYQALRPNVSIKYQNFDPSSYDSALLNALASGNGPDIFMIDNRQLLENLSRIIPVDPQQLNTSQLSNLFPDVVSQDFIINGQIYALPLNMDTLAMFYNSGLFNAAGVAQAPSTWGNIEALVPVFKKADAKGQINQSAVAIGGSSLSVNHAPGILSLLMMQYGTQMANFGTNGYQATFAESQGQTGGSPGLNAFNFYLGFSTPSNADYTWNDNSNNSFDSFAAGKTAMIFGYDSDITAIQNKNPYLNFKVGAMPQLNLNNPVNYASYQGLVVSKQSKASAWAWDFIIFLTTSEQEETAYLTAQSQLPALRSLIAKGINDPSTSIFNRQALTAQSWLMPNQSQTEAYLSDTIKNVLTGLLNPSDALNQAESQINQLGQQLSQTQNQPQ